MEIERTDIIKIRTVREDVGMHLSAVQSGMLLVLFCWWLSATSTDDSFWTVGRWLALAQGVILGPVACWLQYGGRKRS